MFFKVIRLYSKSSLTLKEWRFYLSFPWVRVNAVAGGLVSYLTMWLLTLQLFKNSTIADTQGKLRLNLHSLSVSAWAFRIRAIRAVPGDKFGKRFRKWIRLRVRCIQWSRKEHNIPFFQYFVRVSWIFRSGLLHFSTYLKKKGWCDMMTMRYRVYCNNKQIRLS